MTIPKAYKWVCPYGCEPPTTKGPYYDHALLREAASSHIRAQHTNLLAPMGESHRADARMRHSTKTNPGYAATT